MDRPALLLLGADCRTGLQSARLFAARNIDVYGVTDNRRSPYCRTRSIRGFLDAARFLSDPVEALRVFTSRSGQLPVLMPCTDRFVLWLLRQRDSLASSGRYVLGTPGSTETLVDKGRFARFAIVGRGVPAPVAPTATLVVSGLYRHCRNPMYVAVVGAILGQALLFGSASLLLYAAIVWLAFHLFVLGYEEPTLSRQFTNYGDYRRHVPRWIPRLRPWAG